MHVYQIDDFSSFFASTKSFLADIILSQIEHSNNTGKNPPKCVFYQVNSKQMKTIGLIHMSGKKTINLHKLRQI